MRRWNRLIVAASAVLMLSTASSVLMRGERLDAQITVGEYCLFQPGSPEVFVGWVVTNSDRNVEWWAYFDDSYEWADYGCTSENRWKLEAQWVGTAGWSNFEAWKSEVLDRHVTDGRRLVFQNHAVAESVVDN